MSKFVQFISKVSGALRDTITNVLSTCFPSGIFINARIELDSLRIFSLELAGLLGKVKLLINILEDFRLNPYIL
jgi:hypothetical protein